MLNDGNNIEREGPEVEKHPGDIDERRKEENALTTEENREEKPSEALSVGSWSRLSRREAAGFGAGVTETR